MAFVITQPCIGEVKAACFQVCPCDCIYLVDPVPDAYPGAGSRMAVIDQALCIDCGACLPECPVQAIVDNDQSQPYWTQINVRLAPSFKDRRP